MQLCRCFCYVNCEIQLESVFILSTFLFWDQRRKPHVAMASGCKDIPQKPLHIISEPTVIVLLDLVICIFGCNYLCECMIWFNLSVLPGWTIRYRNTRSVWDRTCCVDRQRNWSHAICLHTSECCTKIQHLQTTMPILQTCLVWWNS